MAPRCVGSGAGTGAPQRDQLKSEKLGPGLAMEYHYDYYHYDYYYYSYYCY